MSASRMFLCPRLSLFWPWCSGGGVAAPRALHDLGCAFSGVSLLLHTHLHVQCVHACPRSSLQLLSLLQQSKSSTEALCDLVDFDTIKHVNRISKAWISYHMIGVGKEHGLCILFAHDFRWFYELSISAICWIRRVSELVVVWNNWCCEPQR